MRLMHMKSLFVFAVFILIPLLLIVDIHVLATFCSASMLSAKNYHIVCISVDLLVWLWISILDALVHKYY